MTEEREPFVRCGNDLSSPDRKKRAGRPVAIILNTETETTPGVKLEGMNATRILTMEEIVRIADMGLTVKQASKVWDVNFSSLARFLRQRDLFDLFDGVPKKDDDKGAVL